MGSPAGSTAHFPLAALVLALFMVGYVMWVGDRLPALAPARAWTAASQSPAASESPAASQGAALRQVEAPGTPAEAAGDTGTGQGSMVLAAPLSPRLAASCEIAMGITMGYMLILML